MPNDPDRSVRRTGATTFSPASRFEDAFEAFVENGVADGTGTSNLC
jgi:hypothetical protein